MKRFSTLILLVILANFIFAQTAKEYRDKSFEVLKKNNVVEAISLLTKAIQIEPKDKELYRLRGDRKSEIEDYRGAILDYSKVIEINPQDYLAYESRGVMKEYMNNYSGAVLDLTKALTLLNNDEDEFHNSSILQNLSISLYKQGNYNEAITYLNKYLKLYPYAYTLNLINIYLLRGKCKIGLKDKDGGCLDFSKALELGSTEAAVRIKEICN